MTVVIKQILCENGQVSRWKDINGLKDTITYRIQNKDRIPIQIANAVIEGVEVWNISGIHRLEEVYGMEDILIKVVHETSDPEDSVIGLAFVTCENTSTAQHATIEIGTEGNTLIGIANVSAHEIGHVLGLGHSSEKGDLMYEKLGQNGQYEIYYPDEVHFAALRSDKVPFKAEVAYV